jgi:O-antigen/teichoic acid export membrane protein
LTNAGATYARSLLVLFLVLFSGRWILQSLGAVDYGVFGVVGSITVFITFLNTVMATSASRHLSYAMGKCRNAGSGDALLCDWFNVSLCVHFFVPMALVLIGYPIGAYAVRHWLVIPVDRMEACIWVFRFSVLSAFVSMSTVPFSAVYVARQRIAEQAVYDLASSVLNFGFAYCLLSYRGDRLIFFSFYKMAIVAAVAVVYVVRSWVSFPETRLRLASWFDREKMRELIGFASWNFFGALGWMVSSQGIAIVGNKFYGPAVNAALSVASQVSGQVTALANSVMSALTPEIVTTEGSGDRERMVRLAFTSCRLATLLNMIFMIPLCFEMQYVLTLWLKHPPEYSAIFCQLTLIAWFLNSLSTGHSIAMGAVGKIRGYQLSIGFGMMLSLPLAWLGCRAGLPPWSILVFSALAIGGCSFGRICWAKILVRMSIMQWVREILLPITWSCVLISLPLAAIVAFLPSSFGRLVLTTAISTILIGLTGYAFILSSDERAFLLCKTSARLPFLRRWVPQERESLFKKK